MNEKEYQMLLIKCCFLTFFVFIFHNDSLQASESIKELNENVQVSRIWMLKQASRGDQETRHLYDLPEFCFQDILEHIGEFSLCRISRLFYIIITGHATPQPLTRRLEDVKSQPGKIALKKITYNFSEKSDFFSMPRWVWNNYVTRVDNIPFEMFPYLEGTQIQAIYLDLKQFKNYAAFFLNFKKFLEKTKIDTLILAPNSIINTATKLAKSLQGTKIGTLDLSNNKVNSHFTSFAIALYNTSIHTLNLSNNDIYIYNAEDLAAALSSTQIHTLDMSNNNINDRAPRFVEQLQKSQIHTLNLSNNGISDISALELIKVLNRTKICRLDLSHNPISDATRQQIIGFNLPIEIIF